MGKINVNDKSMIDNQKKKEKYGNQRTLLRKSLIIDDAV